MAQFNVSDFIKVSASARYASALFAGQETDAYIFLISEPYTFPDKYGKKRGGLKPLLLFYYIILAL